MLYLYWVIVINAHVLKKILKKNESKEERILQLSTRGINWNQLISWNQPKISME